MSFRKNLITTVCLELNIPNRTFLVRAGDILEEFGRAMVRIWREVVEPKYPRRDQTGPGISPKRTKEVRLGIYRTHIQPNVHSSVAISGQIS